MKKLDFRAWALIASAAAVVIGALLLVFHRSVAFGLRRFWIGCPRCGRPFGGHQGYGTQREFPLAGGDSVNFRIVCPACVRDHQIQTGQPLPKKRFFKRRKKHA